MRPAADAAFGRSGGVRYTFSPSRLDFANVQTFPRRPARAFSVTQSFLARGSASKPDVAAPGLTPAGLACPDSKALRERLRASRRMPSRWYRGREHGPSMLAGRW